MKKIAKLKNHGLIALALLLCIALVFTCIAFVVPTRAAAEDPAPAPTTPPAAKAELFDNINIPEKCDYGDSFEVPAAGSGATVTVKAPNGTTVEPVEGKVVAKQMGNYIVTYTASNGAKYDFKVYVSLDEDYFLRVDYNGADIPSYIQKNGTFTIPAAHVYYYNDDNILIEYPADQVKLSVYDSYDNKYEVGGTFTASTNGKTYLTYSARVGADDSYAKYFTQTFTINVQSTFTDAAAPTISVAGVTSDISINRSVTIPQVTATDNYDENIKVEITVVDPDGNKVRLTDVNKYGYAYQDKAKLDADAAQTDKTKWNYPEIVFDNDKAMTFYPVKTGDYVVSYAAYDDAGNKSAVREYHMTCSDFKAPDFYSIEDWRIPETWGLTVNDAAAGKISFPIPEVVDNLDHAVPESAEDTSLISLYFRITDSDNSRTVVEFTNILSSGESDDGKFTANSVYGKSGETYYFNRDHSLFEFDFDLYNREADAEADAEKDNSGTYTVYYRARDKAQNTSSKTYTIKLEKTYTDKTQPSAAEVTVPSYMSVNDESIDIPNPSVADPEDTRPHVIYRVYSDKAGLDSKVEGNGYITVKGGETAEVKTDAEKGAYITTDDGETKLFLGETLYFFVSVTDKAGNTKTNAATTLDDAAFDYTTCEAKVKIVGNGSSASSSYQYYDAVNIKPADTADTTINAGDKVNAGSFAFLATGAENLNMRDYLGFEVTVADPNGKAVSLSLETVNIEGQLSATDVAGVVVSNIIFTPSVDGTHTVTVRVFDVNGYNKATGYYFNVEKASSDSTQTAAANISTTGGSVNVKYQLRNKVINGITPDPAAPDAKYFVARQISGGVFSLVGSELTAKTQGSYSFRDGYVNGTLVFNLMDNLINSGSATEVYVDYNTSAITTDRYTASITDTATPVIEVQGDMPAYKKRGETVVLPSVIAYSENGNAEIDITVKNAKSNDVKTDYDAEKNSYSFEGSTDGAYTVTYTASYANATPVTATYTINIGDVVGPEFTVSGGTTDRQTVGNTFTFGTITLAEGESSSGVTITKKLYDPSREEVSDATVSGSYSSYAGKENNGTDITFDKAGTYEVVYTATDSVGNVTTQRVSITVVSSGSGTPTTITTLSTVLIIVAVVLLAGVIIYVVRFRKVKEKK